MPSIGAGAEELRIRDDTGAHRVIYAARRSDAVYVLHAFQKRSQTTAKRDVELARTRFAGLPKGKQ
jgi:phage-related protein